MDGCSENAMNWMEGNSDNHNFLCQNSLVCRCPPAPGSTLIGALHVMGGGFQSYHSDKL